MFHTFAIPNFGVFFDQRLTDINIIYDNADVAQLARATDL